MKEGLLVVQVRRGGIMPSFVYTQDSFNGGEISPGLRGATRFAKYYSSAERIENYIVTKEGNARYREGFAFIKATKSNNKAILKKFISVNDEKYLLAFTEDYLTLYRDDVQVAEISSPYKETDLFNIQEDQEKDALYLSDGIHAPYKLLKTATDTFTLTPIEFDYPPFIAENLTPVTIQASATTGTITLTASTSLFLSTDIYRYVKIRSGGSDGYAKITSYTSPTVVNATVITTLPTTSPVDTWSFSPVPASVHFFQARLFYGSITDLWGSKLPSDDGTTNYEDFTTGSSEEDAFIFTSAVMSPGIRWLASNDKTLFGASRDKVFNLGPSDSAAVISILNPPDIKTIATDGSNRVPTVLKNNITFFINSSGERLNTLNYSFEIEGYDVIDTNVISERILNSGITQIAFQESKEDIAWCVRNDGILTGLNYLPDQSVIPWFRIKIDGEIESVTTLPTLTGEDRIYVVSKRTINSSTVRYIEYLDNYQIMPNILDYFTGTPNKTSDNTNYEFAIWQAQKEYNNVDSFIKIDGSDSTISTQTMTPGATGGSDITFTAGGAIFSSSDVGREIWEKTATGVASITSYISATQVKCNIISDFASTSTIAAGNWYFTNNTFGGLTHLEGEDVTVISDGAELPDTYTVSSGAITIPKQASQVTIGLKYIGIIKLLPIQGGSANGNSRIKPQLINRFGISTLDSIGGEIGTNIYNLVEILYGPPRVNGRAVLPFTGIKEVTIEDTYEKEKSIYILQRLSLPLTIQIITALVETNESN